MSCIIEVACNRIDCDREMLVDLHHGQSHKTLAQILSDESLVEGGYMEETGWGWDSVGLDEAIHCPEHRGNT